MSRVVLFSFAGVKLALHLFTAESYGYFRDELYYIACTEHLDFGYVDHPAFSVWVLWLSRAVFGDSLVAIRLVPAFVGAATVVLVGLMARELGGGRFAQVLATASALIAPDYLSSSQYYSMNALDLLVWALAAWILMRILAGDGTKGWAVFGAVLAVGLLNKISVLWLGAGIAVGLVATSERRFLATRWPWLAGAIALVGLAPYLVWQTAHGWATLEFIENATTEKMVAVSIADFVLGQIEMMHPLNAVLWIAGLAFYLVADSGRRWRILGVVYVTVFVTLASAGTSRAGYLAPAYTWLLPAGGVVVASWLDRHRVGTVARTALIVVWVVAGAVLAPFSVPLLPVDDTIRYAEMLGQEPTTEERKDLSELPQHYADMHGWEDIVEKISRVVESLPADERARVGILAPDYGVAGAIDFFGERYGLPPASSGHNNYWWWGPHGGGTAMIVIGGSESDLSHRFHEVVLALDTLDCGYCMPYENRRRVWIARRPKTSLREMWPAIRHYD